MINVDEIFEEARVAFDAGRYAEVIAQLSDDVLEGSAHPQLYFFRGMARFYSKMDEKAIEDLSMAIAMKPDYFRAILNRGRIWSQLKQHNNAIADLSLAIKMRPEYASAYRHLGMALNEKRDYDKAILQFDKAIGLEPDSADVYLQRGTAWLGMSEYDPAIEDFDKAIALNPDNASAYTSRGHALYGKKEYDQALESLNNGIRLNPRSGRAYLGLGRVYEKLKEFDLASGYFKRAFYLDYDGSKLVDTFRDNFPAPYIVKSIVANKPKVEPEFATIEWLLATCREWDRYLQHLRDRQDPLTKPDIYHRLEAIVNYYMGNSIASYGLFDTKFDSDEYPYPLTLQDHYYLVLSAMDFNEPDNGLAYALREAGAGGYRSEADAYYAGQLYLLNGDMIDAIQCFDRCGEFVPALYGKLSAYVQLGDTRAALTMAEKIAAVEAGTEKVTVGAPTTGGFLDGIQPLTIGPALSLEEGFALMQQRIYYYELQEVVAVARELLHRESLSRDDSNPDPLSRGPSSTESLQRQLPFHSLLVFTA